MLVLTAALAVACGTADGPAHRPLIEEASPPRLDQRALGIEVVFDHRLDERTAAAEWRLADGGAPRRSGRGLALPPEQAAGGLWREAPFDAAEVDTLEVVLNGIDGVDLELRWRRVGDDRDHGVERLLVPWQQAVGPPDRRYRFALGAADGWRGRIAGLGLACARPSGQTVVLRRVTASRSALNPERLRQAAARPWRVDLDHLVRSAWLTPAGLPMEVPLEVPGTAVLRFAVGVTRATDSALRFRVEALADGEVSLLGEHTVAPGPPRWQEGEVSLRQVAGRSVRLRLSAISSRPLPLDAVPVWGEPRLAPARAPTRAPASAPPNVVVVSIDTLRADRLSLYGYPRPTSPWLDAWARARAVTFERAVAAAPWTLPSHTSLLTGLDAVRHGVNHWYHVAPPRLHTLAERLREAGYATAAVTGGSWLDPRFGLDQGFDRLRYWPRPGIAGELGAGLATANRWLDRLPRPFLLFFHTFAVHDFLLQPSPVKAPSTAVLRARYDAAVHRLDDALDPFLHRLAALDAQWPTVVVVTSDHGESLDDRGGRGHHHLYDTNLLVPLIVALPGGRHAGLRVARQVRAVDLVPTILDLTGAAPDAELDGVSLIPLLTAAGPGPPAVAASYAPATRRGLSLRVGDRVKYILSNAAGDAGYGRQELYLLGDDPGEQDDRHAGHPLAPAVARAARALLDGQPPGLRMALVNDHAEPFTVALRGAPLAEALVTSVDLPAGALEVVEAGAGEHDGEGGVAWQLTVAPGAHFALLFEYLPAGLLELTVRTAETSLQVGFDAAGDHPSPDAIPGEALPVTVLAGDHGWTVVQGQATASGRGVTLAWQAAGPAAATSPLLVDDALRRQLRALGYLE